MKTVNAKDTFRKENFVVNSFISVIFSFLFKDDHTCEHSNSIANLSGLGRDRASWEVSQCDSNVPLSEQGCNRSRASWEVSQWLN